MASSTLWSTEDETKKAGSGAPFPDQPGAGSGVPFGASERRDAWWVQPLVQALALGGLLAYATWAALQGKYFEFGNYLSPFYSPLYDPPWRPSWFSPALFVLVHPGRLPRHLLLLSQGLLPRRSSPTRRAARWAKGARAIAARPRSRSSCRTCIATSSTWRRCS